MPPNKTGLRPHLSDKGPQTNWEVPKAKSSAVSVSWACTMLAPKPWVKAGKAGKYKSVVMGCKPSSNASKITVIN
jgi:hypothetical protein